jgi:hypothetical protein
MVNDMRTLVAAMVVAAMLFVPLGLLGTASAAGTSRDLTPVVIGPVSTDRLGGGELVAVKAGDALFGVRYGTTNHTNDVVIFAEYKRFLGGAEIVDAQGSYLATRGIPVYTVFAQSLNRFIEFQQRNASDGFDLMSVDHVLPFPLTQNVPVKALSLNTAWSLSNLTNETVTGVTYVNFTVSATNLRYTRILNNTNLGDGMLNRVAFTFHLMVSTHDKTARIPWYRVTVSGGDRREISHVEFLGYRNITGPAIGLGAKYDHLIEGWDFASMQDKLALETHLIIGNYIPDRTADFVHLAYGRDRADDGNRSLGDAATLNETAPTRPHLYTRDRVYFDDDFTRIGRFEWASGVTVDGRAATMTFNVQGGGRIALTHGGAYFVGFWLRGAFVYPAGAVIEHDPVLSTEAFLDLPSGVNLTPLTILAVQLAVVGIAMGPAVYLRAKARRQP